MSDTVFEDSIKAHMPIPILTIRVLGEPTHKQVKIVIWELTTNRMAVSCSWGHGKGHLGLLHDPAIYLTCNRGAFNILPTNCQPIQSFPMAPPLLNAKNSKPTILPYARHGPPTSLF